MNIVKYIAQILLVSNNLFTYYKKKKGINFDNVLFIERILLLHEWRCYILWSAQIYIIRREIAS